MCTAFWAISLAPSSPSSSSSCTRSNAPPHASNGSATRTYADVDTHVSSLIESSPYALVLASNRDLNLQRPTSDASWHGFERLFRRHNPNQNQNQDGLGGLSGFEFGERVDEDEDTEELSEGVEAGKSGEKIMKRLISKRAKMKTKGKGQRFALSGRDLRDPVGGTWLGLSVPHQEEESEDEEKEKVVQALTDSARSSASHSPIPESTPTYAGPMQSGSGSQLQPSSVPASPSKSTSHSNGNGNGVRNGHGAANGKNGTTVVSRLGILTNIHDDFPLPAIYAPPSADSLNLKEGEEIMKSRGELLSDWLSIGSRDVLGSGNTESDVLEEYVKKVKSELLRFEGFNLILFEIYRENNPDQRDRDLHVRGRYITNRNPSMLSSCTTPAPDTPISKEHQIAEGEAEADIQAQEVTPPLALEIDFSALKCAGGVSNITLTETYPKVQEGNKKLAELLEKRFGKSGEVGGGDGGGGSCDDIKKGSPRTKEEEDDALVKDLMDLMSTSHQVNTFQDLSLSLNVPLIDLSLQEPHTLSQPETYHNSSPIKFPHEHVVHPFRPGRISSPSTPRGEHKSALHSHKKSSSTRQQVKFGGLGTKPASLGLKLEKDANPYGTRTTTVILVRKDGSVTFVERDRWWLDAQGQVQNGGTEDRVFRFQI